MPTQIQPPPNYRTAEIPGLMELEAPPRNSSGIVVCLGGLGTEVGLRTKYLDRLLGFDAGSYDIQYVVLDSDSTMQRRLPHLEVGGKRIAFSDGEVVTAQIANPVALAENSTEIASVTGTYAPYLRPSAGGAGRIRMIGKLNAMNSSELAKRLSQARDSALAFRTPGGRITWLIVTSTSGGVGSGAALQVGGYVRCIANPDDTIQLLVLTADVLEGLPHQKEAPASEVAFLTEAMLYTRTHFPALPTALKQVHAAGEPVPLKLRQTPFDCVYLLGGAGREHRFRVEELTQQAATLASLYLRSQAGPAVFGAQINAFEQHLHGQPAWLYGLGASLLRLPIREATQLVALTAAEQTLSPPTPHGASATIRAVVDAAGLPLVAALQEWVDGMLPEAPEPPPPVTWDSLKRSAVPHNELANRLQRDVKSRDAEIRERVRCVEARLRSGWDEHVKVTLGAIMAGNISASALRTFQSNLGALAEACRAIASNATAAARQRKDELETAIAAVERHASRKFRVGISRPVEAQAALAASARIAQVENEELALLSTHLAEALAAAASQAAAPINLSDGIESALAEARTRVLHTEADAAVTDQPFVVSVPVEWIASKLHFAAAGIAAELEAEVGPRCTNSGVVADALVRLCTHRVSGGENLDIEEILLANGAAGRELFRRFVSSSEPKARIDPNRVGLPFNLQSDTLVGVADVQTSSLANEREQQQYRSLLPPLAQFLSTGDRTRLWIVSNIGPFPACLRERFDDSIAMYKRVSNEIATGRRREPLHCDARIESYIREEGVTLEHTPPGDEGRIETLLSMSFVEGLCPDMPTDWKGTSLITREAFKGFFFAVPVFDEQEGTLLRYDRQALGVFERTEARKAVAGREDWLDRVERLLALDRAERWSTHRRCVADHVELLKQKLDRNELAVAADREDASREHALLTRWLQHSR